MRLTAAVRSDLQCLGRRITRSIAEVTLALVLPIAIAYALAEHEPKPRALTHADMKLQAMVWSPVGIRARWCAAQGECGR